MSKAYGSITITDLLDTATYIYYAATNSSSTSDWHTSPQSGDKFIGIYSGPAVDGGQPDPITPAILSQLDVNQYVGDASQIWTTTTAPTTPNYTFTISNLSGDSGSSPRVGDLIFYSYYRYTITSVSSTTVLAGTRQNLRGGTGAAGTNTATVYLYQRAAGTTAPAVPTNDLTYTFASATITGSIGNWSTTIPTTNGKHCWVTSAVAAANTATDVISGGLISAGGDWAVPTIFAEDGVDANKYTLEIDHEEIYKFMDGQGNISLTSSTYTIGGYKEENNTRTQINLNSNSYYLKLSLIPDDSVGQYWDNRYSDIWGNNIVTKGISGNFVTFNISSIISSTTIDANFVAILKEFEPIFVVKLYEGSSAASGDTNLKATKFFRLIYGSTSNMAKFDITAAAINAAVNNTSMSFTEEGLIIKDGDFIIKDNQGNNLLSYVKGTQSDDPKLIVQGNSIFSGRLEAATGNFHGDIYAENGWFHGDITGATGKFTGNIDVGGNSKFGGELKGASGDFSGKVTAQEGSIGGIEITENALKVSDDLWISNNDENTFINAGNVKIQRDGTLKIGSLVLDGNNSEIRSNGSINHSGVNWYINPNEAYFNNIIASGKITSSIFEVSTTQSVGGSMLFKPAYKVQLLTSASTTLTLQDPLTTTDQVSDLQVNDYIMTTGSVQEIRKVTQISNSTITLDSAVSVGVNGIIVLGHGSSTPTERSILLGVNSQDSQAAAGILPAQGFSVSEMVVNNNKPSFALKAFLGNLSKLNLGVSLDNGNYGLYSDNVILNGSLTTKIGNEKYAGVNTLNGTTADIFNQFNINDNSKIVFWAGSLGTSSDKIRQSPFQVTETGSVFASAGAFTGVIISKSKIKGADLYAARIHGGAISDTDIKTKGADYGLAFFDTNEGIVFKTGGTENYTSGGEIIPWGDATTVFRIGTSGFSTDQGSFISIYNKTESDVTTYGYVDFKGENLTLSQTISANDLILSSIKIDDYTILDINNGDEKFIDFKDTNNKFTLTSNDNTSLSLGGGAFFNASELITNHNFRLGYGTNTVALQYKEVDNVGYDLYIE